MGKQLKLFVQIPCLNEEGTIAEVIKSIPSRVKGVSTVDIVVIDDGSDDKTAQIAAALGVSIVKHTRNRGLAEAFRTGIRFCLENGADIVVNTDGDNQYCQRDLEKLVAPVIQGEADLVIGDRQVDRIPHFSRGKKFLQKLGSSVVSAFAGQTVLDAGSGFRAYSRDCLLRLNTVTRYSYTMETTLQVAFQGLAITNVQIATNPVGRPSRLFRSATIHVAKSAMAILRSAVFYRPFYFFLPLSAFFLLIGGFPFIRFLWERAIGGSGDFIQSLILGVPFLVFSFLTLAIGVLADLVRVNRVLAEEILQRMKV